jgi:cellulose biosynthesis protein BcsQ
MTETATYIDQTISSRPIRKPLTDDEERAKLVHMHERTEAILEELEARINAKETNERYKIVLRDSQERLNEIARNAMLIPPTDAMRHAEALGNFKERILLTRELLNLKVEEKKQRGIFSLISRKLSEWAEKKG